MPNFLIKPWIAHSLEVEVPRSSLYSKIHENMRGLGFVKIKTRNVFNIENSKNLQKIKLEMLVHKSSLAYYILTCEDTTFFQTMKVFFRCQQILPSVFQFLESSSHPFWSLASWHCSLLQSYSFSTWIVGSQICVMTLLPTVSCSVWNLFPWQT